MNLAPKLLASIFLFRTFKTPFLTIAEVLTVSPIPLLACSLFLLGFLGSPDGLKILPILASLIWKFYDNGCSEDFFFSSGILGVAFLTGWSTRTPVNELPVDLFSNMMTIQQNPFGILIVVLISLYILKNHPILTVLWQILYLALFISADTLSFVCLYAFILVGLLTRRNKPNTPFLSFYFIESILTVGTLFTSFPINLFFGVGSILAIWQLAKINDYKQLRHRHFMPRRNLSDDSTVQELSEKSVNQPIFTQQLNNRQIPTVGQQKTNYNWGGAKFNQQTVTSNILDGVH
jgi:hypothetical protein